MNEFCDICPLKGVEMSDWQAKEAQRIASFERSEQEHMAAGTYNRFVDGLFLESADENKQLHGSMRVSAFICGEKQANRECLIIKGGGGEEPKMVDPEFENHTTLEAAIPRLHQILFESGVLRQLDDIEQPITGEVAVDLGMTRVAIDQQKAEMVRDEIKHIVSLYPGTYYPDLTPLESGPSYIDMGAALDSQRTAIGLFALGEALGLWTVLTPKKYFGNAISEVQANNMIGMGFIMVDGYNTDA